MLEKMRDAYALHARARKELEQILREQGIDAKPCVITFHPYSPYVRDFEGMHVSDYCSTWIDNYSLLQTRGIVLRWSSERAVAKLMDRSQSRQYARGEGKTISEALAELKKKTACRLWR